jgi:hypothetical protein
MKVKNVYSIWLYICLFSVSIIWSLLYFLSNIILIICKKAQFYNKWL